MAIALNQTGTESITVSGSVVGTTLPLVTTGELTDPTTGLPYRQTPRHALIQCYGQPVRYASNLTIAPSGVFGQKLLPGETLDLTDPHRDYYGFLKYLRFVLDVDATEDAQVEIDYFQ